jgi:hypothetical protein
MLVEFHCPSCGKTHRAADKYSGRRVQCRNCHTILQVPGLPPIQSADELQPEPEPEPVTTPDLSEESFTEPLPKRLRAFAPSEPEPNRILAADNSHALASLFLATLSFLLFFTPAVLASMLSLIGASIAFFAGAVTTTGCFLFCWKGLRLVENTDPQAAGQGYVIAARLVNKFFLGFYVLAIVFFLVVGTYVLVHLKPSSGGTGDMLKGIGGGGDMFKALEQLKGLTGQ